MSERTGSQQDGDRRLPAPPPPTLPASAPSSSDALTKLVIEMAPLALFFLAYAKLDIYWATGILMTATLASLIASWWLLGKVSAMPVVTAVLVAVFGGLTLWLREPRFIYIKPTLVYLLFAIVLGGGLLLGKQLLRYVFDQAFKLSSEGWHKLTVRWTAFFFAMAGLNELIWRNFSESTWVAMKAWGFIPLTLVFMVAQVGLIKRYSVESE